MPRFRLDLEYDGGAFRGWQRQENGIGVQQVLEEAVLAFAGERVTVHGGGRTDTGVHALGQVAHIDLVRRRPPAQVRMGINYHLARITDGPVVVLRCTEVGEDFHARFSAMERCYRYRILNRVSPPALDRGRWWWIPQPLDARAMHEAAQGLVGHHDFASFRAAGCQASSSWKTLDELEVVRTGDHIDIRARARSFLYRQVRIMVGSLVEVGRGRWSSHRVRDALEARDRPAAGATAPAAGLYLEAVVYPDDSVRADRR